MSGSNGSSSVARADARPSCGAPSASCSPRTRTPTATRSARWPACSSCSPRSARTPSPTWRRASSRCPTSTASSRSRTSSPSRPPTSSERTIVFLDCGNIDRNPADSLKREGAHILNIDHHHDNTQFGTVNHVVPEASCTAEVIWDLMKDLGVELTRPIAEALYVGLVTDTGKFMYENTGPQAHQMAAELIDAGVDVHAIYRRIFEGVPQGKLELLARGLTNVERFDDGLLTLTHLSSEDYAATGADPSYSEGVVDHLRALEGTAVAGLVRDLPAATASSAARCRCAPPTTASTSRRSRAPRAAAAIAAPPASRPPWTTRSWSRCCGRAWPSSSEHRRGHRLRQAGGDHLARRRREGAAAVSARASRSATRARSTRSRRGCCSCSSAARRACSAS